MSNTKGWCGLALGLLVAGSGFHDAAWAQSTVTPEQEYQQLIKVNQDIQPLGANPFGENISPYDGSPSFEETDVSLPCNATSYMLEVVEPAVSSALANYTQSSTSWNNAFLYNGKVQFELQPCNANGCSGLSQPQDITVNTSGCPAVVSVPAKQSMAQPQSTPVPMMTIKDNHI